MLTPKITVLVPVYNVEAYLAQCLDSLRKQNFQDCEIICINDGSTDGSLNILEQYAAADGRFKIISKENRGYGHSMNLGLKEARGDYIGIVESDDYIEPAMFETLYNLAQAHRLDVARCNYYQVAGSKKRKADLSYIPRDETVRPLEHPAIFYQPPAIWANLYKRQLLQDNKIAFLETPGAAYQDTSFIFKVYALCERFRFIDEPLLNYRLDNPNSSVNNAGKALAVCNEYKEILSFAKQHEDIYEKLKKHIPVMRYACYAWNLKRLNHKFRMAFLKQWRKEIHEDYKEGRIDEEIFSVKRKKRMRIIRYFPLFYKWRKRAL